MTDKLEWSAENSDTYRLLARIAVPQRAEQIAALLMLIPFRRDEPFRAVELASGEGRLAAAILTAFPRARLLALDGEDSMRAETNARLEPFADRGSVGAFDITVSDWYGLLDGVDVVVSSLCVHHLDGAGKQALFNAAGERLSDRGALLIADLVAPTRAEANRLFAATWDSSARGESRTQTGADDLYDLFAREHWNYYRYPDPFDQPSPLVDQLLWLRSAGFAAADCYWMQAGHAIYGGCKRRSDDVRVDSAAWLTYDDALAVAREALG